MTPLGSQIDASIKKRAQPLTQADKDRAKRLTSDKFLRIDRKALGEVYK